VTRPSLSIKSQVFIAWAVCLLFTWLAVGYELNHSLAIHQRDVEHATVSQAQAYAENTLATIKRLDEVVLDLRDYWIGDIAPFAELVRRRQQHLSDIAFQVAIIDADGYLAYSNLAAPNDRTYLGEREHFRVHKERQADQLFISKPLKGKVSGKWSIQFTRPIMTKGRFNGVLVVSASPEAFATFLAKLGLGGEASSAMLTDGGVIMARHPGNESAIGKIIANVPFLRTDAPVSGGEPRQ
jgi:C4-dicarboxylate-specific signal transduction histidine kinase